MAENPDPGANKPEGVVEPKDDAVEKKAAQSEAEKKDAADKKAEADRKAAEQAATAGGPAPKAAEAKKPGEKDKDKAELSSDAKEKQDKEGAKLESHESSWVGVGKMIAGFFGAGAGVLPQLRDAGKAVAAFIVRQAKAGASGGFANGKAFAERMGIKNKFGSGIIGGVFGIFGGIIGLPVTAVAAVNQVASFIPAARKGSELADKLTVRPDRNIAIRGLAWVGRNVIARPILVTAGAVGGFAVGVLGRVLPGFGLGIKKGLDLTSGIKNPVLRFLARCITVPGGAIVGTGMGLVSRAVYLLSFKKIDLGVAESERKALKPQLKADLKPEEKAELKEKQAAQRQAAIKKEAESKVITLNQKIAQKEEEIRRLQTAPPNLDKDGNDKNAKKISALKQDVSKLLATRTAAVRTAPKGTVVQKLASAPQAPKPLGSPVERMREMNKVRVDEPPPANQAKPMVAFFEAQRQASIRESMKQQAANAELAKKPVGVFVGQVPAPAVEAPPVGQKLKR